MHKNNISERGQVLVIIALVMIGLIGITGLAIDGSMVLNDRRHAQNAADTAVLAGALTYIRECEDSGCDTEEEIALAKAAMDLEARNRADSNGYSGDLLRSQVEVYTCDDEDATCPDPYDGDSDYVQVLIISHVNTTFARVLGIPQMHNRVQAISLADDDDTGPLFDGSAIIALNPDCPMDGSMQVGGDAEVTITGGGMFSNSDDACAFKCKSASVELSVLDGEITTAGGGFDLSAHCKDNMIGETSNTGSQMLYPPETPDLPVPDQCNSADPDNYHTSYLGTLVDPEDGDTVQASYIYPGYYGTFPPKKDQVTNKNLKDNIFMLPGIYCVKEIKQTGGILMGDDVTIYVRPENGIGFQGGVTQLTATQSGPFAGYLVVVSTNYPDTKPASCTVNGNSYNIFQGSIFAPHCDVTINGDSTTPDAGIDAQIIGFNVKINGGAGLTINYDADENPIVVDPPKIGVAK
jgi:hypothetical protein